MEQPTNKAEPPWMMQLRMLAKSEQAAKRGFKNRKKYHGPRIDYSRPKSLPANSKPSHPPTRQPSERSSGWRGFSKTLKTLGYGSYPAYLQSGLWFDIRCRVFQSKGRKCIKCDLAATEVHHSRYDIGTMRGESLDHLHPVCRACHGAAEIGEDGKKRGLEKANESLGIIRQPAATHCRKCGVDNPHDGMCKRCRRHERKRRRIMRRKQRKKGVVRPEI